MGLNADFPQLFATLDGWVDSVYAEADAFSGNEESIDEFPVEPQALTQIESLGVVSGYFRYVGEA